MKFKIFIICFCCTVWSFSQKKKEVEQRVDKEDFPEQAISTLEMVPETPKRFRYFKETDGDKISYEAKFKLNKHYYSVEFSEQGKLEDIEVLLREREIEDHTLNTIKEYLESNYKSTRLLKIQRQYLNIGNDISQLFNSAFNNVINNSIQYELIIETKKGKLRELAEFTFTQSGAFISKRVVKPSSYDYVLY